MRAGVCNVTDSGPFKTNRLQAALAAYDELTSNEREEFKRARHLVDADEPWEGSIH
jgi:hypothetical protein